MNPTHTDSQLDSKNLQLILRAPPSQIAAEAANLSSKQLFEATLLLNDTNASNWNDRLFSLVNGLKDHAQLEAVGSALTSAQMLELLNHFAGIPLDQEKLTSLLIGMAPNTLGIVLRESSQKQLSILKELGRTEALQHHLLMLCNSVAANEKDFSQEFYVLDTLISNLDLDSLGYDDIVDILKQLQLLAFAYKLLEELIDRGLTIAWHTDRQDIIEKFNIVRGDCASTLAEVGQFADGEAPASGLFLKLGNRFLNVFGNPADPHDIEALHDDDDAIEALAKFSVWYLKDYFELGLLPNITSEEQLDLDKNQYSETERSIYKNQLLEQAKHRLGTLGLITVADVKKNTIFSRKTLKEFIQRNKTKLS